MTDDEIKAVQALPEDARAALVTLAGEGFAVYREGGWAELTTCPSPRARWCPRDTFEIVVLCGRLARGQPGLIRRGRAWYARVLFVCTPNAEPISAFGETPRLAALRLLAQVSKARSTPPFLENSMPAATDTPASNGFTFYTSTQGDYSYLGTEMPRTRELFYLLPVPRSGIPTQVHLVEAFNHGTQHDHGRSGKVQIRLYNRGPVRFLPEGTLLLPEGAVQVEACTFSHLPPPGTVLPRSPVSDHLVWGLVRVQAEREAAVQARKEVERSIKTIFADLLTTAAQLGKGT